MLNFVKLKYLFLYMFVSSKFYIFTDTNDDLLKDFNLIIKVEHEDINDNVNKKNKKICSKYNDKDNKRNGIGTDIENKNKIKEKTKIYKNVVNDVKDIIKSREIFYGELKKENLIEKREEKSKLQEDIVNSFNKIGFKNFKIEEDCIHLKDISEFITELYRYFCDEILKKLEYDDIKYDCFISAVKNSIKIQSFSDFEKVFLKILDKLQDSNIIKRLYISFKANSKDKIIRIINSLSELGFNAAKIGDILGSLDKEKLFKTIIGYLLECVENIDINDSNKQSFNEVLNKLINNIHFNVKINFNDDVFKTRVDYFELFWFIDFLVGSLDITAMLYPICIDGPKDSYSHKTVYKVVDLFKKCFDAGCFYDYAYYNLPAANVEYKGESYKTEIDNNGQLFVDDPDKKTKRREILYISKSTLTKIFNYIKSIDFYFYFNNVKEPETNEEKAKVLNFESFGIKCTNNIFYNLYCLYEEFKCNSKVIFEKIKNFESYVKREIEYMYSGSDKNRKFKEEVEYDIGNINRLKKEKINNIKREGMKYNTLCNPCEISTKIIMAQKYYKILINKKLNSIDLNISKNNIKLLFNSSDVE